MYVESVVFGGQVALAQPVQQQQPRVSALATLTDPSPSNVATVPSPIFPAPSKNSRRDPPRAKNLVRLSIILSIKCTPLPYLVSLNHSSNRCLMTTTFGCRANRNCNQKARQAVHISDRVLLYKHTGVVV